MEPMTMTMGATMFSRDKPWLETTGRMVALLDASYKALKDAEPERTYLGASMMGKECARAVAYQYHQQAKDPDKGFSGQLYRIFDMGHDGETRMATYLKLAGFYLKEKADDGSQYGYCVADGRMQGHIDGVITSGPDVGCEWPALWENKALNDKGFRECEKHGIERAKPLYFAQVQVYMAYMQLSRCLFTCLNRNSGEVFSEVIDLDPVKAQAISDRGVRVISSVKPEEFARIGREATDFRCKFCDYLRTCWGLDEAPSTASSGPSWLTRSPA